MKKLLGEISILFVAFYFVLPQIGSAATSGDLQAQINALLAQLQQLQAQLASQGGSIVFCHTFQTNIFVGQGGSEVSALQTALRNDGEAVSATGSFDDQTASAVTGFQEKYASDILVPNGLQHGTGYVGSATRAKLNSINACGTGNASNPAPVITFPTTSVPTQVSILFPTNGSTATAGPATVAWADTTSDSNARYVVLVSAVDSASYAPGTQVILTTLNRAQAGCSASDKCSYPLSITAVGTYRLSVTNQASGSSAAVTFVITSTSANPSVTVLSPNGGETYSIEKGAFTAQWQATDNVPVNLYLLDTNGNTVQSIAQNVTGGNLGVQVNPFLLQKDVDIFQLKACLTANTSVCDTSNGMFSFISAMVAQQPQAPQILYPQGGETLQGNVINNISWNPVTFGGTFDVSIVGISSGNNYLIAQGVPAQAADKQSIQWTPQSGAYQKDTQFVAQVCRTGTTLCSKSNGFTINFLPVTPSITLVPSSISLTLQNQGNFTFFPDGIVGFAVTPDQLVNWSAQPSVSWLIVTPSGFASSGSNTHISIAAQAALFAPGVYTGTVVFSPSGSSNFVPQTETINLTVASSS